MYRVLIDTGVLMNTWGMRVVGTQPGGGGRENWELTLYSSGLPSHGATSAKLGLLFIKLNIHAMSDHPGSNLTYCLF